ncbi:hypothetical protein ACN20G_19690 [Streptomyces sp. BI20]|uniref:hypothetical protein n=1 Tax=Streptomyces sp. BI20 TaxID=3403460 RepID=UPI003C771411
MLSPRRFAGREWGPLYRKVGGTLVTRGWRAVPLTLGAVALTAVFQLVQNTSWGLPLVRELGTVRAADPLGSALLRTPLSLFVPALDLPVWGALAQVLLVFGISEIAIGRARTLVVAYLATVAGTGYARVGLALGPEHPLGLPDTDRVINDTGPSAAVVGLAVYVCLRYGAYVTAVGVVAAMVGEVLWKNNLAGREHLAAIAAVLLAYAVATPLRRRRAADRARTEAGPAGPGGPPRVPPVVP